MGIKASIKKMYELLSICKRSRLPCDFQKYKSHIKILDKVKIQAENNYYREKSELYGRDRSKTWRLVNEITSYKKKKSTIIKSLIDKNGQQLTDPTDIANSLNDHFGSIGRIMAQKFDAIDRNRLKNPLSFISKKVQNSLFLYTPNLEEISKDIDKLADSNSSSYDGVSNRTLKATNDTISPYLEILFHKCIQEGVFPDSFKIAQVIPLFKGGKKDDRHCYRPISLLPTISKIFEKILARRLIKFLTKYEVLSKDQFGFRAKFSTEYAIADIYDKLIQNLDEGLNSCAIFLDLAKAFDSVSHKILLQKLHCYGIRGTALDLFTSYLTSRSQFVKLPNGIKSSLTEVEFGVPQGSILGPILFLLFINDLPNATDFYVKLFADDTFLCSQNSDFSLLQDEVDFELEKVFVWLASNKLTLNIKKSKFMLITKRRKIPKFSVKINGSPLESCDSYKYLGVIIDKKLNWKSHITHISPKIIMACGALAKLKNRGIKIDVLKNVFHALVHSYIRYGILIWGKASPSVMNSLQTLMNRAIRIMTNAPFGNIDLNPAYTQLGILKVSKIHSLEAAKFHFKSVNNLLPIKIGNFFLTSAQQEIQHSYGLRNRNRIQSPRFFFNSITGKKSIQFTGSKIWEDMPEEIKNSESFTIFKKSFKKYLLEDH